MSVLDRLDATRLCARWSAPLDDPAVWARPIPVAAAATPPTAVAGYSWRSLAGNPHALVLTAMVGAVVIKDAVLGVLTAH